MASNESRLSLVGRLLAAFVLSSELGIDIHALRFSRAPKGRPVLVSNTDLRQFCWNISHHEERVVLAIDRECDHVGIDVMPVQLLPGITSEDELFDDMSEIFTASEWNSILHAPDRLQHFYIHWCCKEAYVKALGRGLEVELGDIEIKIETKSQTYEAHLLRPPSSFAFWINVSDSFVICTASSRRSSIAVAKIDLEVLLSYFGGAT